MLAETEGMITCCQQSHGTVGTIAVKTTTLASRYLDPMSWHGQKSKGLTTYLVRLSCTRWLRTQKAPYNNPSLCFVDKHLLSPSDTSLHVWQENRTFRVNFSCRFPKQQLRTTKTNFTKTHDFQKSKCLSHSAF